MSHSGRGGFSTTRGRWTVSSAVGQAIAARRPVHAAERLDRLPVSRWLTGVMAILFLGWLVESYDIGLTGSVLPSLTALYHLNTAVKSAVSVSSRRGGHRHRARGAPG